MKSIPHFIGRLLTQTQPANPYCTIDRSLATPTILATEPGRVIGAHAWNSGIACLKIGLWPTKNKELSEETILFQ